MPCKTSTKSSHLHIALPLLLAIEGCFCCIGCIQLSTPFPQLTKSWSPATLLDVSHLQLLYDLVFEKAVDHKAPACSSTHRDTKNRTMLSHERSLGGQLTTNRLAFTPPTSFDKPEFARKPLIRDSFFRKTNVVFPPGCDATTAN